MKKLLAVVLCFAIMVLFASCCNWKETLEEYKVFIDEYVEVMKSGEDLTEFGKEDQEWNIEIEELRKDLEDEEKEEFEAEVARITMNRFLLEYEVFVDEYIETAKAGKDLTELEEKGSEWIEKNDELSEKLEGEEKEKFDAEIMRITMNIVSEGLLD